jgi:hypothetical protein
VGVKDYIDIHALMTKGGVRLNAAYLRQSAKTLSREASFDVVRYSMLPGFEADESQEQTSAKLMKEGVSPASSTPWRSSTH